jgi:hypothetical protein
MEAFLSSPRRCAGVVLVACAVACGSSSKSDDGSAPEPSGGATPSGSSTAGRPDQEAPASALPEPEGGPSPSTFVPRYFVSPRGSDSNVCSQKEPCREISRALQLVTAAGASILAAEGDYGPFEIKDYAGSQSAPLIVRSTGVATITAATTGDAIRITHSSWVYLERLRANGAAGSGLAIAGSQWVTARKCVFGDNARSNVQAVFSDDVRLELNEAYGSLGSNGISIMASSDRPVIRWNHVYGNRYAGIQIDADYERPDSDGTYGGAVDGLTTGAVVAGNVVAANGAGGGAAINLDGVKDSLLVNNVLYDNLAAGLAAYGDADGVPGDGLDGGTDYDGEGRFGPSGLRIVHNTIIMPATSKRAAVNLRYSQGTTKNLLVNNILVHENPNAPALELGFAADVALLDATANAGTSLAGPASTTTSSGGIRTPSGGTSSLPALSSVAGIAFVDRANGDLHQVPTSKAVDVGATLAEVTQDADGKARPQGGAPDLGAYEVEE